MSMPAWTLERLARRTRTNGECIEWTGLTWTATGYGRTKMGGKEMGVHRLSWILHNGPILDGLFVCHRCDNIICVRIEHLFLGTAQDNMTDKVSKGRHRFNEGLCKLTEDQARDVLVRLAAGETQESIGRLYGILQTTVSKMKRGLSWKHLARPS